MFVQFESIKRKCVFWFEELVVIRANNVVWKVSYVVTVLAWALLTLVACWYVAQ